MRILQNIDDSKVHLVQTEYSTYAISLFHKKNYRSLKRLYIRTELNNPNVNHAQSTNPEQSRH